MDRSDLIEDLIEPKMLLSLRNLSYSSDPIDVRKFSLLVVLAVEGRFVPCEVEGRCALLVQLAI